ncbi:MAG: sigma-70 family RNA polymerase sigma factor, partial [Actinomycetota bacterium]|nr:sigma-70 family RNA polymerase sigma factor [Actinomycetota bacterium]
MPPVATVDERLRSLPDPVLATAAAAGERSAFEELYRRNVPAAWRVAHAVAGNRDDASDAVADAFERVFRAVTSGQLSESAAFRPYLLTATRRAAINISRRSCRAALTDEMANLDGEAPAAGPQDRMVADLDAALLGQAFRQLPERWRSVLWLLEVEDLSAQEAGDVLGLRPNTVAQLAVRARMGLRKRYLAAHVSDPARPECTVVVERLGAYIEGTLGHRRAARIDLHLRGCPACRRRKDEIQDLGVTLRRSVLPMPVGLAAVAAGGWRSLSGRAPSGRWLDSVRQLPAGIPGSGSTLTWASTAGADLSAGASVVERVVSWATAGVLVLGLSVGVVQTSGTGAGDQAASPGAVTAGPG